MKPFIVTAGNALAIADWIEHRKGIAIWESIDLSDPGYTVTTPVETADGKPTPKPSWKVANTPARVITSVDEVVVSIDKEVKRFHVGVRVGGSGLKLKLTDGATHKVRKAVEKAGEGAYHVFDYMTQEAVIMAPESQTPLADFMKKIRG